MLQGIFYLHQNKLIHRDLKVPSTLSAKPRTRRNWFIFVFLFFFLQSANIMMTTQGDVKLSAYLCLAQPSAQPGLR